MFYLTKRALIVGVLLLSSAFAQTPTSWNPNNFNPEITEIKDERGQVITLLTVNDLPKDHTWKIDDFFTFIVHIKDNNENEVSNIGIDQSKTNHQLFKIKDKFFLLPETEQTATVTVSTGTTAAAVPAAGMKRNHMDALPEEANSEQPQPNKKQKVDDGTASATETTIQKTLQDIYTLAQCWRIHPSRKGYFQLLDTTEKVLHTGEIRTRGKERKLRQGNLLITEYNRKSYRFSRHPDDNASLAENGFTPTASKPSQKDYKPKNPIFTTAVCWRVHPNKEGFFQLLDAQGCETHCNNVRTRQGGRKLNDGRFRIVDDGRTYLFLRHPDDNANLAENGFAPKQTAKILKTNIPVLADRAQHSAPGAPNTCSNDNHEFDDEDEEMLDEETLANDDLDNTIGAPGSVGSDMDESDDDDGYPFHSK